MRSTVVRCAVVVCLAVSLCGCEGLARKFRRVNKKPENREQGMVVVPEEYQAPAADSQAGYQQAYLFWKSWHEELNASLESPPNRKHVRDCLQETIKNAVLMRDLLPASRQEGLAGIIAGLEKLGSSFDQDIYNQQLDTHRSQAQSLYTAMLRSYAFSKVRDDLQ